MKSYVILRILFSDSGRARGHLVRWLRRTFLFRVLTHCSNLGKPGGGAARANPHFNPVVPYYAAGRDPSWYLADGPPKESTFPR